MTLIKVLLNFQLLFLSIWDKISWCMFVPRPYLKKRIFHLNFNAKNLKFKKRIKFSWKVKVLNAPYSTLLVIYLKSLWENNLWLFFQKRNLKQKMFKEAVFFSEESCFGVPKAHSLYSIFHLNFDVNYH